MCSYDPPPQFKMNKLDVTNGWGEPPHVPPRCWPSLQHSLISHHCQRGNSPPRSATKPRQLFKTGCLSEASFPSNKQSAKPDFGRQGGSTRVTLFPHPVSWSIGAPEGALATGAGKAQACSGNLRPCARLEGEMKPIQHHSGVCAIEQWVLALRWGGGHCMHAFDSTTPYPSRSIAGSVYWCYTKRAICLHIRKEIWYKPIPVHRKATHKIWMRGMNITSVQWSMMVGEL